MYDSSVKVPAIINWPREIEPWQICESMLRNLDPVEISMTPFLLPEKMFNIEHLILP